MEGERVLVLKRKNGSSFTLGDDVRITITEIDRGGAYVKIGIDAPRDIQVRRDDAKNKQPRVRQDMADGVPLHEIEERLDAEENKGDASDLHQICIRFASDLHQIRCGHSKSGAS